MLLHYKDQLSLLALESVPVTGGYILNAHIPGSRPLRHKGTSLKKTLMPRNEITR